MSEDNEQNPQNQEQASARYKLTLQPDRKIKGLALQIAPHDGAIIGDTKVIVEMANVKLKIGTLSMDEVEGDNPVLSEIILESVYRLNEEEVFISYGLSKGSSEMLKLVIDAPRDIAILTLANYRKRLEEKIVDEENNDLLNS